jgi:hypothetical protein
LQILNSFSSEINAVMYPQRVALPLKKNAMTYSQKALLPIQSGTNSSPLQIKMTVWRTFFEFELAGSGMEARCRQKYNGCLAHFKFKKTAPNGHCNLH